MINVNLQSLCIVELGRRFIMKTERYIQKYITEHNISTDNIKKDTGLDLNFIFENDGNLLADDFLRLCVYLGITPEEIGDQIL